MLILKGHCVVYVRVYEKHFQIDNVAEWLRRETRNLLGFPRTGSNPVVVEFFGFIQQLINNSFAPQTRIHSQKPELEA